jgi:hypothetical protein
MKRRACVFYDPQYTIAIALGGRKRFLTQYGDIVSGAFPDISDMLSVCCTYDCPVSSSKGIAYVVVKIYFSCLKR